MSSPSRSSPSAVSPDLSALTVPAPTGRGLLTRDLRAVLLAHLCFSLGWSIFLVQPKFLAAELHASATVIGTAGATGGLAAVATILGIVHGIDRVGRRPFFRAGSLLLGLAGLGYLALDRVGPLVYLLQACTGASFVLAYNASASLYTDYTPVERMGHALGVLGAANLSMTAVATTLAERVAESFGWHAVFSLATGLALLALALSLRLPPGKRPAHTTPGTSPEPAMRLPWRAVSPVLAVTVLTGGAYAGLFMFHQPYALHLGARHVGSFFVGFSIAGVSVRLLLGGLGDRHGRRQVSMALLLVYALGIASAARLQVAALWAHGLVFGAAHGVLYPTLNAVAVERAPDAARGRVIALYNGSFNVGTAISALCWGLVADHWGYPAVFLCAAGLPLVGFALLAHLGSSERRRRRAV